MGLRSIQQNKEDVLARRRLEFGEAMEGSRKIRGGGFWAARPGAKLGVDAGHEDTSYFAHIFARPNAHDILGFFKMLTISLSHQ